MNIERIVVVTKPTRYEELLLRHGSQNQAAFFLRSRGENMDEYRSEHDAYHDALAQVLAQLPQDVAHTRIARQLVATFLFRATDLIVAVGPDGLCVNVAKYTDAQPIIGVNPDPSRVAGVLMLVRVADVAATVRTVREDSARMHHVTLAQAKTNDGQTLFAVNDFMIGRRDQASAVYTLTHGKRSERQSSSGVLVCTGVGSTGWMLAVVCGASAIASPARPVSSATFPWNARSLLYAVREPWPSKHTGTTLVFGRIQEGEGLSLASHMPEGGTIFSDGVIEDAIVFNAGTTVTITVAEHTAVIVEGTASTLSDDP